MFLLVDRRMRGDLQRFYDLNRTKKPDFFKKSGFYKLLLCQV